eukprot:TRINITY_DN2046_c0_g3_i1.p2 TRINITY_DN2046_c0_g3~~TRINITY_DN2046_c0_g3_i1.p2  ORF type:complete len:138 (-),score=48.91 TRINITY_DN2046_c0_g3_i1:173-586(-)
MKFSLILLVFLYAVGLAAKARLRKKESSEERLIAFEKKIMYKIGKDNRVKKEFTKAIRTGELTEDNFVKLFHLDEDLAGSEILNAMIEDFRIKEMSGPIEYHMVNGRQVMKCKTSACEIFSGIAEFIEKEFKAALNM